MFITEGLYYLVMSRHARPGELDGMIRFMIRQAIAITILGILYYLTVIADEVLLTWFDSVFLVYTPLRLDVGPWVLSLLNPACMGGSLPTYATGLYTLAIDIFRFAYWFWYTANEGLVVLYASLMANEDLRPVGVGLVIYYLLLNILVPAGLSIALAPM